MIGKISGKKIGNSGKNGKISSNVTCPSTLRQTAKDSVFIVSGMNATAAFRQQIGNKSATFPATPCHAYTQQCR